jgi:hypothetical protein
MSACSKINPDKIGRRHRLAIGRLNCHEQKPLAILAPEEIALAVFSVESLGLWFRRFRLLPGRLSGAWLPEKLRAAALFNRHYACPSLLAKSFANPCREASRLDSN